MFHGPPPAHGLVVRCKGRGENIPAPVETLPAQPIAARCPLCAEHRRYLPSEIFQGRLSHFLLRKPVRTADGRTVGAPRRSLLQILSESLFSPDISHSLAFPKTFKLPTMRRQRTGDSRLAFPRPIRESLVILPPYVPPTMVLR
jgi:hypothetical protein